MTLAYSRVNSLVSRRRLVDAVSVEFEESRDRLPEDDHKEGDHQPGKKATETSENLETLNEMEGFF